MGSRGDTIANVQLALESARRILDNEVEVYSTNVEHHYLDKFRVAEQIVRSAAVHCWGALHQLGFPAEEMYHWRREVLNDRVRAVVLQFDSDEKCSFNKVEERKVERSEHLQEASIGFLTVKRSEVLFDIVKDYYYDFDIAWRLQAEVILTLREEVDLQAESGRGGRHTVAIGRKVEASQVITNSEELPRPEQRAISPLTVNITWLLRNLPACACMPGSDEKHFYRNCPGLPECKFCRGAFTIDLDSRTTRTPRRNKSVDDACHFFTLFIDFCNSVNKYFLDDIFRLELRKHLGNVSSNDLEMQVKDSLNVVRPVNNLQNRLTQSSSSLTASLEKDYESVLRSSAVEEMRSIVLSKKELVLLAEAERESLRKYVLAFQRTHPDPDEEMAEVEKMEKKRGKRKVKEARLITYKEATLVMTLSYIASASATMMWGLDIIESVLRSQLMCCIGKAVGYIDFAEYMRHHHHKYFLPQFRPRPFFYNIGKHKQSPEGTLSLQVPRPWGREPLDTFVRYGEVGSRSTPAASEMQFGISASSKVRFSGKRYVHGAVMHQFETENDAERAYIIAQAHAYSSFMILLGTIGGPDLFVPKHALILKNKQEVRIPLLMEALPTAKEFKKAVSSLSPEMQAFSQAYRAMQLESTLTGVVVIQLKPQMERVLRMPHESLTKELDLTDRLMDLFIKFQISSDFLRVQNVDSVSPNEYMAKIQSVQDVEKNCLQIEALLSKARGKQLEAEKLRQRMRLLEEKKRRKITEKEFAREERIRLKRERKEMAKRKKEEAKRQKREKEANMRKSAWLSEWKESVAHRRQSLSLYNDPPQEAGMMGSLVSGIKSFFTFGSVRGMQYSFKEVEMADPNRDIYIQSARAFVIMFDVTNNTSTRLIWSNLMAIQRLKNTHCGNIPIVIIGNKCDKKKRELEIGVGDAIAYGHWCSYFEVSTKRADQVYAAVYYVLSRVAGEGDVSIAVMGRGGVGKTSFIKAITGPTLDLKTSIDIASITIDRGRYGVLPPLAALKVPRKNRSRHRRGGSKEMAQADMLSTSFDGEVCKSAALRGESTADFERELAELNEIFKDLSQLVEEQSCMLDVVESNIACSNRHVERSSASLFGTISRRMTAVVEESCEDDSGDWDDDDDDGNDDGGGGGEGGNEECEEMVEDTEESKDEGGEKGDNQENIEGEEEKSLGKEDMKNDEKVEGKDEEKEKRNVMEQTQLQLLEKKLTMRDDYTKIPKELERRFDDREANSALRPTIVSFGDPWERVGVSFSGEEKKEILTSEDLAEERQVAFDLLDAITCSGAVPILDAELHVFICGTHCFDRSVMDTIVMDNVNPIERVTESTRTLASVIFEEKEDALLFDDYELECCQSEGSVKFDAF